MQRKSLGVAISQAEKAISLESLYAEGQIKAMTSLNNEVLRATEWPCFPSILHIPPKGSPQHWMRLDKSRYAFQRMLAQILPMPDGSIPHEDCWLYMGSNIGHVTYCNQITSAQKILFMLACCSSHLPPGPLERSGCRNRNCINPRHFRIDLATMKKWAPPIWPPRSKIIGLADETDLAMFMEIISSLGVRPPQEGPEMDKVNLFLSEFNPQIAAANWEGYVIREFTKARVASQEEAQPKREVPGDKTGLHFPDF